MRACLLAALMVLGWTGMAQAAGGYADTVKGGPELRAYWRLGASAADETGNAPGTLVGGVALGASGALSGEPDTAARFDGVDDELQGSVALAGSGTLEGWFFWEAGVALARDTSAAGGWILAFDSGGRVAYRAGGVTFTTALTTAQLRDGWHHVVLTFDGGATAFYVDGALVHAGAGAGTAAPVQPWRVMRNGTVAGQFTRGRADEVAIYGLALPAETVNAHFLAGRDVADATPPAAPTGLKATVRYGRVELTWSASGAADLDGYDVLRATSASGPWARVNASRLETTSYSDTTVAAGTTYLYAVTAGDTANNRSAPSSAVAATPPSTEDLLRRYAPELRYETQETYFADSAAEMTDNYVRGTRTNFLVNGSGTRIAASDPSNPLADLSLGFLGSAAYANGTAVADTDYLDAANNYQQDAQRMRAAGYADRVYGRFVRAGGRNYLQYWFFFYYNPQNVLGFGVHEGDWEFAQVALDDNDAPTAATYAQHGDGERCAWTRVQRTSAGAPVVFVALASHASYFASGVTSRGLLPADNHRGSGYRVRPQVEVVTPATPFMAWRGRWGASSSSPIAPRRQGSWLDPAGFESTASACSVGTIAAAAATRRALRTSVPGPRLRVRRAGEHLVVRYRFPTGRRPSSVLVSASAAPDVATARRVAVHARSGTVRLAPPSSGPLVIEASAFSRRGIRSTVSRARLP
jgi:hypothetical protein